MTVDLSAGMGANGDAAGDALSGIENLAGSAFDDTLTGDAHCRTAVPGLYAIGDVTRGLNQITVATGQAAIAATTIHNMLPWALR